MDERVEGGGSGRSKEVEEGEREGEREEYGWREEVRRGKRRW